MLLQETVETFVGLYTQTITEQAERLRQFTRMATHEWRQPLAPISTAVSLLRLPGLQSTQQAQTVELIARNVTSLVEMTYKLERLARIDGATDNASLQNVSISQRRRRGGAATAGNGRRPRRPAVDRRRHARDDRRCWPPRADAGQPALERHQVLRPGEAGFVR